MDEQEKAVLDYLNSNSQEETNKIYHDTLEPALTYMIKSIMHRYKLYVPYEDTGATFNDAISFLMTKADKYDKSRNKKAYSYYGNICKNYIIGRIQDRNKQMQRNPSYDTNDPEMDMTNNLIYSNQGDEGRRIASEIVDKLTERIQHMVDNPEKFSLKPNEVEVGKALYKVLDNWDYIISTDGSSKLNKNAILLFLREQTKLETKSIREAMKKFKGEFLRIKKEVID